MSGWQWLPCLKRLNDSNIHLLHPVCFVCVYYRKPSWIACLSSTYHHQHEVRNVSASNYNPYVKQNYTHTCILVRLKDDLCDQGYVATKDIDPIWDNLWYISICMQSVQKLGMFLPLPHGPTPPPPPPPPMVSHCTSGYDSVYILLERILFSDNKLYVLCWISHSRTQFILFYIEVYLGKGMEVEWGGCSGNAWWL